MKKKYFLLIALVILPMTANATLLGRVNTYYSLKASEKVQKAEEARNTALADFKVADKAVKDGKGSELTTKEIEKLEAKRIEKSNILNLKSAELQLAQREVKPTGPGNDNTGVAEGEGPISISRLAGKNITSIDFNAYRFNVLLWKAKCKIDGQKLSIWKAVSKFFGSKKFTEGECKKNPKTQYRFMPAYVLLHKSLNEKIVKDVLVQDLLDNERGGLVNLKFTPMFFNSAEKTNLPTGMAGFLDFGVKIIEAPSAVEPDSTTFEGGGYLGVGLNFEFGIYEQQVTSQNIVEGAAPEGAMAIGFGVYRNTVSTGFDTGLFAAKIPTIYDTFVLGYEYQVSNLIAISGTRAIPAQAKGIDTLGTYSSLSVKYKF